MSDWRLLCAWDGESLVPANPVWAGRADKDLVVGEKYYVCEYSTRSKQSHNHYFAQVAEAFDNLPEALSGRFRDPDHLRKAALVHTGFYIETAVIFSSKADAQRAAALVSEDGAVVSVYRNAVIKRVPMSQSYRSMGKAMFQESKTKTLEWIADQIGVEREQLEAAAQ